MDACSTLARLFALALSLPLEYFEQPGFFDNPTCMLGMNTYYFPKVCSIIRIRILHPPNYTTMIPGLYYFEGKETLETLL